MHRIPWGPFGSPLGPLWVPLGPFGSLWVPLGLIVQYLIQNNVQQRAKQTDFLPLYDIKLVVFKISLVCKTCSKSQEELFESFFLLKWTVCPVISNLVLFNPFKTVSSSLILLIIWFNFHKTYWSRFKIHV